MNITNQMNKKGLSSSKDCEEVVSCLLALGKQQSHLNSVIQDSPMASRTSSRVDVTADESVSNESVPTVVVSDDDLSSTQNYPVSLNPQDGKPKSDNKITPEENWSMPEILMGLLLDPSFDDMITFLPDKSSFVILSPKLFSDLILPRFFSMTNFNSFVRKLERYGFQQIEFYGKVGHPAFRHTLFRKNDPELCKKIQYHPSLQKKKRKSGRRLKKSFSSNQTGDYVSVHKQNEKECENTGNEGALNRQHVLEAQLRALQDEKKQLTTNKCIPYDTDNLYHRSQKISSDDDIIKATKSIVDAAIDCLLVDEDHTRKLLARHSLRLRLQRNTIFPPDYLMLELLRRKSNILSFDQSNIEQNTGIPFAVQSLDHNDNLLSLLTGKNHCI